MNNNILPLGSVVLLNNGTKKVMIIGYYMKTPEKPDKIYDYCGCVFPEGVLRSDVTSVFNHDQIKEVCFIGFKNEESNTFLDKVTAFTTQMTKKEEQKQNLGSFPMEALETE